LPNNDLERQDLERRVLEKRVTEKRALSSSNAAPKERTLGDVASGANESIMGFSPAADIPVLGPLAQKAGSAAAATVGRWAGAAKEPTFYQEYQRLENQRKAEQGEYAKKQPILSVASSLIGSSAIPAAGIGKIATAGKGAIQKGLGYLAEKGSTALGSAGISAADAATRDGDAEQAGKESLMFSGILDTLGLGGRAIKRVIPRTVFGVRGDTTKKYLERAPQINEIDEEKAISLVDEAYSGLKSGRDTAKEAMQSADLDKRAAQLNLVSDLKREKIPDQTIDQISDTLKNVRKEISFGSSKAFDVLKSSGKEISITPMKGSLTSKMKDFHIGGQRPPPGDATGYDKLEMVRAYLDQITEGGNKKLSAEDAKKFVQYLDDTLDQAYSAAASAGGYVTRGDRALKDFRKEIDSQLKKIPEYAAEMAPLSNKVKLLNDLQKHFKNKPASLRTLENIGDQANTPTREALKKLETETGTKIFEPIEKYEFARAALGDQAALRSTKEGLPESKEFIRLVDGLKLAQEKFDPVKGMSLKSSGSIIKKVGGERNKVQQEKMLRYLGDQTGQDFVQMAKDLGVKNALDQGFLRGSRNVNLGAFSLGGMAKGVSSLLGGTGEGGGFAQAIGAGLGAAADVVGPQTYKKILDISMTPQYKKYAKMLSEAAQRSPQALAVTHNAIKEADAGYRQQFENEEKRKIQQQILKDRQSTSTP